MAEIRAVHVHVYDVSPSEPIVAGDVASTPEWDCIAFARNRNLRNDYSHPRSCAARWVHGWMAYKNWDYEYKFFPFQWNVAEPCIPFVQEAPTPFTPLNHLISYDLCNCQLVIRHQFRCNTRFRWDRQLLPLWHEVGVYQSQFNQSLSFLPTIFHLSLSDRVVCQYLLVWCHRLIELKYPSHGVPIYIPISMCTTST